MEQEELRILLIEDCPADTRLLEEELSDAGVTAFHVTYAGSLSQAARAFSPGSFDVVLLDLSLPDTKGLETVRRAVAAMPAIPLVILTTLDDESLAVQAIALGAQDYLVKGDADGHVMIRAIRHALARERAVAARVRGQAPEEPLETALGVGLPSTVFGHATLSELFPDVFDELSQQYGRILVRATAPSAGTRAGAPDLASALPALAQRLCVLRAGPADALALHECALRARSVGATAHSIAMRADQAALVLLQLMGHLAAAYQRHPLARSPGEAIGA